MWSINDTFSFRSLMITAPTIALSTYLVVFNLNSIIRFWLEKYHVIVDQTIALMKTNKSETWVERGKASEKFTTVRQSGHRPSEWRILQYILWYFFAETCHARTVGAWISKRLPRWTTGKRSTESGDLPRTHPIPNQEQRPDGSESAAPASQVNNPTAPTNQTGPPRRPTATNSPGNETESSPIAPHSSAPGQSHNNAFSLSGVDA
jgi:hypothetical protein